MSMENPVGPLRRAGAGGPGWGQTMQSLVSPTDSHVGDTGGGSPGVLLPREGQGRKTVRGTVGGAGRADGTVQRRDDGVGDQAVTSRGRQDTSPRCLIGPQG